MTEGQTKRHRDRKINRGLTRSQRAKAREREIKSKTTETNIGRKRHKQTKKKIDNYSDWQRQKDISSVTFKRI